MARPIWSGAINFGLVNIPIEMVTAVHEKTVHFHMLSKDGTCRLRRKLYCPESDKEYDFNQTARGLEVAPDEYVIVDQKEINRLKPEKGKAMEIEQFVPLSSIDPVFYDRVYYLQPGKASFKPYALLVKTLDAADKCAIARFVMRERQHIAVIRVLSGGLVVHTLHYADEVDHIDNLLPKEVTGAKVNAAEVRIADELVKSMTKPLDIESFRDEYRERLQKLIDAKIKGKELVEVYDEPEEKAPRATSLMDALKRSLAANKDVKPASNRTKVAPKPHARTTRRRRAKV